jgi:putative ABC transport system permease protein
MPDGFQFPYTADAWTPATMVLQSIDDYAVFGRLKAGVSVTAASHAMVAVSKALMRNYPTLYSVGLGFRIQSVHESLVGDQGAPAIILAAVAGFFLLLACFNVASLQIARSVARRPEVQVRVALGASRGQLLRGNLAETLVYSVAGGIAGIAVAAEVGPYLNAVIPSVFTRQLGMTGGGDFGLSLSLAMALSLCTSLIAGLLPAITSASTAPDGVGRGWTRVGNTRQERLWMDCFVTVEFIIALALIAGAGLMLQNFSRLAHRDLGIDAARLLAIHVSTTDPRYTSAEARRTLVDDLVRAAQTTPGVSAAAVSTVNPLGGTTWTSPVAIEAHQISDRSTSYVANHRLITPRLFEAMGIRLIQGRLFTDDDGPSAPGVAIISWRMAQKYWPGNSAIGKRVRANRSDQPWLIVVGVVSDVVDSTDRLGPRETWYLPYAQNARTAAAADIILMVRSVLDPRGIEQTVERSVHSSHKDIALYDSAAMDLYYLDTLSQQRLGSILIAVLAGFGLLLGALGIYGTLSFSVGERVHEIGVRMALGSDRLGILGLIMKQGLRISLVATVLGLGAAWAMGRLLASQLSEVRPNDPITMFGAACLLLIVACVAIYVPARRAAALDPISALRRE